MSLYSFTKADRLLKRNEFKRLFEEGKKIQNRNFILVYGTGTTDRCRLGITVSKRVGNAVTRNRMKRRIREFFRQNSQLITGIWDINIIAKSITSSLNHHQVQDALSDLFKKVNSY